MVKGGKQKNKRTNNDVHKKIKDRSARTPLMTGGELRCFWYQLKMNLLIVIVGDITNHQQHDRTIPLAIQKRHTWQPQKQTGTPGVIVYFLADIQLTTIIHWPYYIIALSIFLSWLTLREYVNLGNL